jgi:hypothetical protein
MPLDLQIIRASEFIRLGARGHFDMAVSRQVLAELAHACRKRGVNRALLDLRALQPGPTPIFSPDDLASLVNTFREMGFTHEQKLAILYAADPHHRARLFAFIGRLRGWHVCAFGNFEEAIAWLSDDAETPVESGSDSAAEPVKVKMQARVEAPGKAKIKIRPKK